MNKKIIITSLFEDQTKQTPDAIALISGKERLTYRHLNEKANQMAHYLVSLVLSLKLWLHFLTIILCSRR